MILSTDALLKLDQTELVRRRSGGVISLVIERSCVEELGQ
jgi:hypothetical protein